VDSADKSGWAGAGFTRPVQWDGETAQPWVAPTRPCLDDACPGRMEPEEDGDVRYWACATCGSETSYIRVRQSANACQLGLNITVDPAMPPGVAALEGSNGRHHIFIGDIPVRRPRAGDGL
jgi:hypothetical protein